MLSLKKLSIFFLIAIAIALVNGFVLANSAKAATHEFQWTGQGGYSAKGTFSYDEKMPLKTISEKGAGKTNTLKSLQVTFYSPKGELINTYKNVVEGVVRGNYFEFNFDLATQKIFGTIDIGGESSGEIYLKGTSDENLSLINVDGSGLERITDENFKAIAVSKPTQKAPPQSSFSPLHSLLPEK
jgi:hypothetical protein